MLATGSSVTVRLKDNMVPISWSLAVRFGTQRIRYLTAPCD